MKKRQLIKLFLDTLIDQNRFEEFQDKLCVEGVMYTHNYISRQNYLDSISEEELEKFYNILLVITDGEFDKIKIDTNQF